jgi:hypothetical protein
VLCGADARLLRRALSSERCNLQVQGRMAEISASHTGSRIIQACIKLGSQEQRRVLQKELAPAFVELAKSPYGHFVASKLVGTATKVELAGARGARTSCAGSRACLHRGPALGRQVKLPVMLKLRYHSNSAPVTRATLVRTLSH